jgi:hypothetical protein
MATPASTALQQIVVNTLPSIELFNLIVGIAGTVRLLSIGGFSIDVSLLV